jgi:hypothetical protein
MAEPMEPLPGKQVRFLPQSPVGSIHSQMFGSQMFGSQSPLPMQQNPFGIGGGETPAFGARVAAGVAAGAPGHSIPAGPLGRLVQHPSSSMGGSTGPAQGDPASPTSRFSSYGQASSTTTTRPAAPAGEVREVTYTGPDGVTYVDRIRYVDKPMVREKFVAEIVSVKRTPQVERYDTSFPYHDVAYGCGWRYHFPDNLDEEVLKWPTHQHAPLMELRHSAFVSRTETEWHNAEFRESEHGVHHRWPPGARRIKEPPQHAAVFEQADFYQADFPEDDAQAAKVIEF